MKKRKAGKVGPSRTFAFEAPAHWQWLFRGALLLLCGRALQTCNSVLGFLQSLPPPLLNCPALPPPSPTPPSPRSPPPLLPPGPLPSHRFFRALHCCVWCTLVAALCIGHHAGQHRSERYLLACAHVLCWIEESGLV